jgi:hypothetical protein
MLTSRSSRRTHYARFGYTVIKRCETLHGWRLKPAGGENGEKVGEMTGPLRSIFFDFALSLSAQIDSVS